MVKFVGCKELLGMGFDLLQGLSAVLNRTRKWISMAVVQIGLNDIKLVSYDDLGGQERLRLDRSRLRRGNGS